MADHAHQVCIPRLELGYFAPGAIGQINTAAFGRGTTVLVPNLGRTRTLADQFFIEGQGPVELVGQQKFPGAVKIVLRLSLHLVARFRMRHSDQRDKNKILNRKKPLDAARRRVLQLNRFAPKSKANRNRNFGWSAGAQRMRKKIKRNTI
jgi:hypothetical protein